MNALQNVCRSHHCTETPVYKQNLFIYMYMTYKQILFVLYRSQHCSSACNETLVKLWVRPERFLRTQLLGKTKTIYFTPVTAR